MSIIINLSEENFKKVVQNSNCYADICRNLGLRRQGGYYRTIKRRILKENINISHFIPLSQRLSKAANFNWISKESFLQRLNDGEKFCDDTLKKKIIEFDMLPFKCSECNLGNIWNGKRLVLQLDHIDGIHTNNKISNLRWMCPNCHSQTVTFCGKHKKTKIQIKTSHKFINPSKRPPKETLIKDINSLSFLAIGRKYGVSDNAVRKWCKFYGLPHLKRNMVGDAGLEPAVFRM